jgi:capsular exopolysaccharide synthesis family protein
MEAGRDLTLRDYGRVVLRRKWIVVAAVAAALLGALVMSLLQDPIYRAEAQMLVEPRASAAVFEEDPTLNVQNLERAIQTEIEVLEGERVRDRVREDLGLAELPPEVDASPVGSTDVVSVAIRSEDPATAQLLADAYVRAYTAIRREQTIEALDAAGVQLQNTIDELQAQIDTADDNQRPTFVAQQAAFRERLDQLRIEAALTTGGASVVKSAELPEDPVEPRPLRTAALAGVVGLLLGLGAAFLVDHLDDSLRTPEDLEALSEAPVLGVVPVEPPPDHRPIAISAPGEFAVEIYRGLRTNIQFLGLDKPLRVVQVTSSLPGEGKTTTASNLAVVLAQAGNEVVVVDADLRNPRLHEVFATPLSPGLTEVLLGETVEMAVNHRDGGLHVVSAGAVPPNPSEMLSSARLGALLGELSARYEYVVVDSAPVLPVADAVALSRAVDGVLLVAQASRTSKRDVAAALDRLAKVDAPVFGLLLNRAKPESREGYGYGYNYGYRGEAQPVRAKEPFAPPAPADQGPPVVDEPATSPE